MLPRIGTPEMAKLATQLEAMYWYQFNVQVIYDDEPYYPLDDDNQIIVEFPMGEFGGGDALPYEN